MKRRQAFPCPSFIDGRLRLVHRFGGLQRLLGVIRFRQRGAKHGHDGITNELHDRATVRQDASIHLGAMLIQLMRQHRGVRIFRDRRVAANVRHQHGDHQRFGLANPSTLPAQLFRQSGRQEPAEALTLLFAVDDRLMQQLEAPQRARAGGLRQLQEQLLDRVIDISRRRPPGDRDRLDRPALRQLLQQVFLVRGQIGPLAGRLHQRLDDFRVQHRAAGRHLANCPKQLVALGHPVLQQIGTAGGAFTQERNRVIRFVKLRQHDDASSGMALAHLFGGIDPFPLKVGRHADVGHDHLRCQPLGAGDEAVVVAGHPDHLQVRGGPDQGADALPDDQVVIRQEHGNLVIQHAQPI